MFKWFTNLFNRVMSNEISEDIILQAGPAQLHYYFNDPTTPSLSGFISYPTTATPGFAVRNLSLATFKADTTQGRAAQVYQTLNSTTHFVQKKLEKKLTTWTPGRALPIYPEAGKDFNAYYDRRSLRFFSDIDPVTKKRVHTCQSVDIVAHELGHAILDAIRPDFWNMQALEIWSFHEAFGDCIAILGVTQQDAVIEHALKETDGDLKKSNIISRLAEEMGKAIYDVVGGKRGFSPNYLRDAVNNFKYIIPETLPSSAPDNQLAGECHSFGRVFVGAWYDILVGIYNFHKTTMNQKAAFIKARDDAAYLLLNGIRQAPAVPRFYDSIAKAMIAVDRLNGSKYSGVLNSVFKARGILRSSVKMLSNVKFDDLKLTGTEEVFTDKDQKIKVVRNVVQKTVKLSDHFGIRAQSDNPLYNVEIEVPSETYMEFNEQGNLIEEIKTSEKKVIDAARACIQYLHKEKMYALAPIPTDSLSHAFSIVNGKLERNFIVCSCGKCNH